MSTIELRPPLPPPLSHEGITFVKSPPRHATALSPNTVVAIAMALNQLLPSGDFVATGDGRLELQGAGASSAWSVAARLDAVERNPR
jgi:hypothetical protein